LTLYLLLRASSGSPGVSAGGGHRGAGLPPAVPGGTPGYRRIAAESALTQMIPLDLMPDMGRVAYLSRRWGLGYSRPL